MDIQKIAGLVENSQLSEEAKDLIAQLLPNADKPEVKQEILRVFDFEIEMNEALANEAEEMMVALRSMEEQKGAIEDLTVAKLDKLEETAKNEFAKLDNEMNKAQQSFSSVQEPTVSANNFQAQPPSSLPETPVMSQTPSPAQEAPQTAFSTQGTPVQETSAIDSTAPAPFPTYQG